MEEKPDILCLNEIFSKSSIKSKDFSIINIPGYVPYHQNPVNSYLGVAIMVSESLNSRSVNHLNSFNNSCESTWVEIDIEDDTLIIGCVYRQHDFSKEDFTNLNSLVDEACKYANGNHLVIAGDFNFKEINWDSLSTDCMENHPSTVFLDTIILNGLTQNVHSATRQRGSDKPSLLDLVFSNDPLLITTLNIDSPIGQSDHCTIIFSVDIPIKINSTITEDKLNYFKGDYDTMRLELENIEWGDLLNNLDTEQAWSVIKHKLNESKKHIPKQKKLSSSFKNKPLWMNRDVQIAIKTKKKKWKKMKNCPTTFTQNEFKQARNKCTSVINKAKKSFEKKIANEIKTNPKSFWNYVNSQRKCKPTIPHLLKPDNNTTSDDLDKANTLNTFFSSVFVKDTDYVDTYITSNTPNTLSFITITEEQVHKKLSSLNQNKSPGPDHLHPKLIYELSGVLVKPFTILFNKSIQEGVVPQDWKIAKVTSIYKKGDRSLPDNYRPVSLTSIICRILESIIRDNIDLYLTENNLLSKYQYGFRSGRSCTMQLIDALEQWTHALNEGTDTDIILLDFSKAFDSVSHKRLLNKLDQYGITGKMKSWIHSFLTNRTQFVQVNNSISNSDKVLSGVPQGSVLGPTLFLLYINDLPDCVTSKTLIFADDTKIFKPITSPNDIKMFQADIDSLHEWSSQWGLKFNSSKCVHLHIGIKHDFNHIYTMMDQCGSKSPIKRSLSERDLGVIVSTDLKPKGHIDHITSKANKVLSCIRRSFSYIDKNTFIVLYKSLVRPILEYASPTWSPFLLKDIRKIEQVQRRATKLIPNIKDLSYPARLASLGLPSLLYRRDRQDLILVFQIFSDENHPLRYLFIVNSDTRLRGHSKKLLISEHHTCQIRKFFFSQRVIRNWNKLPQKVISAKDLNDFKSLLNNVSWHTNKFNML